MNDVGLRQSEISGIIEVLKQNPKITAAAIFGSRAKGTHAKYSDVDIAVYGDCGHLEVESIICDLDELPTPYIYDVVSYELIKSAELIEHIDRVGVRFYDGRVELFNTPMT